MKQLKIFSLILFLVMILQFLSFSFPDISFTEETEEAEEGAQTRIKNCISCCAGKKPVCYNMKADLRLCEALYQECVATCNSEGASSSEWSDCWSQSDK